METTAAETRKDLKERMDPVRDSKRMYQKIRIPVAYPRYFTRETLRSSFFFADWLAMVDYYYRWGVIVESDLEVGNK